MSGGAEADVITRAAKRAEVMREIQMRRRVFPRWVAAGRLTQDAADRRIAVMEAIAADYAEPDLFDQN